MPYLPVSPPLRIGAVTVAPPRVSLADELTTLADTLEGAQLLAELLATGGLPDDEVVTRAPKMLEAALALTVGRVRLLRKVVIEAADVALLEDRKNRARARRNDDDPDVLVGSRRRR